MPPPFLLDFRGVLWKLQTELARAMDGPGACAQAPKLALPPGLPVAVARPLPESPRRPSGSDAGRCHGPGGERPQGPSQSSAGLGSGPREPPVPFNLKLKFDAAAATGSVPAPSEPASSRRPVLSGSLSGVHTGTPVRRTRSLRRNARAAQAGGRPPTRRPRAGPSWYQPAGPQWQPEGPPGEVPSAGRRPGP